MEKTKKNKSSMSLGERFLRLLTDEQTGAAIILAVVVLILALTADNFLSTRNLTNLLRYASFYVMVGVGVLVIFRSGAMDLSLGATMGMSGILAAMLAQRGMPLWLILIETLVVGALIGAFNGYLVGYWGFPAFIATLGSKQVVRGLITVITGGYPVNGLSEEFTFLGAGSFLGIPVPIYVALAMMGITAYVLNKTVFGRHVCATGGNTQAALVSGINTRRIQMLAYVYGGCCAAIAGTVLTARITSGQVNTGDGFELDAIAGAIIGGAAMDGSGGTVTGVLCGILVIYAVKNGMTLLAVNAYWQQVVQGAIIIIAIFLDIIRKKQRK
ncbi:ABC transporter permease [Anaerofilum sp. BX8]|uniref:ABC transporter permease n=1 Tax=Anaerofilum hominis TaxID=2763016 RepID=A0A923L1E9_9FIRM|nr:ABC transporter permease [Anaerofilum hominis]MBC5581872.1 ABC transporter permease [Anaerofilum hominis]